MKQHCEESRYKEVGTSLASDSDVCGYFGTSVTVAGNRLVVGSDGTDITAVDAGKVNVYDWNGVAYVEVAQLTASDAQAYDYFGASVAIYDTRLVVGAHFENTAGVAAGKVYIYDWNGTAYVEVAQLTASDADANDQFGGAVAISGNRLVVGAYGKDTAAPNAGKVYIYEWNPTTSTYVEVAQLTASDADANDQFGVSVTISRDSNRLVVGARGVGTTAVDAGKVYIYDWNCVASVYDEVAQLTASDAEAYDQFGRSTALSGTRLVVGAHFENTAGPDAGKVYVYDWSGSAYVEVAQLTASDAEATVLFGGAVAVDGERLLVAAFARNPSLTEAGNVYIYDWNGVD